MSNSDPAQQLASDISGLQNDVNSLQAKARLTDSRDALAALDTTVSGMPQHVRDIRARGYIFEKDLEEKASDFNSRWPSLRGSVQQQIDQQASQLEVELRPIESQLTQLNAWSGTPDVANPLVQQAKSAVSALDSKTGAIESSISGTYSAFKSEVEQFDSHLKQLDWVLAQVSEASFQMLPGEGPIMAVNAVWCKQGKQ